MEGDAEERIEEKPDGVGGTQYRAKCEYALPGSGARRTHISALGPWRERKSQAEADTAQMRRGFFSGGHQGLMDAKNELYRTKPRGKPEGRRSPSPPSGGRHGTAAVPPPTSMAVPPPVILLSEEEAAAAIADAAVACALGEAPAASSLLPPSAPPPSSAPTAIASVPCSSSGVAGGTLPFEVEGPNERSHYRVLCKFKKEDDWRGEAAKPYNFTGPWRGSREEAEEDGHSMLAAYEEGGLAAVRARKNQLHAPRPANSPPALADISVSAVEIESSMRDGQQLYRAACAFQRPAAEEAQGFGKNPLVQSLLGPWRGTREEADADGKLLLEEFERGGVEAATARKNELRRALLAETPSERHVVVPSGELGQEQMGERYGPGFALLRKMGYTVGAGLGPSGQGLTIPINVLDGGPRRLPYDREGLTGTGEAVPGPSSPRGGPRRPLRASSAPQFVPGSPDSAPDAGPGGAPLFVPASPDAAPPDDPGDPPGDADADAVPGDAPGDADAGVELAAWAAAGAGSGGAAGDAAPGVGSGHASAGSGVELAGDLTAGSPEVVDLDEADGEPAAGGGAVADAGGPGPGLAASGAAPQGARPDDDDVVDIT